MVGQSGPYVNLVKADGIIEMRAITVGEKYSDMTAVTNGITTSDQVVSEGQLNLYPGMKVVITTNIRNPMNLSEIFIRRPVMTILVMS